jgi:hypothetical protein
MLSGNLGGAAFAADVGTLAASAGCGATQRFSVGFSYGGFQADVTVTAGATALTGRRVSWTFANEQTFTQIWGGRNATSGSTRNVSNETWNGNLGAGASTTFGFIAMSNSANSVPAPSRTRA